MEIKSCMLQQLFGDRNDFQILSVTMLHEPDAV